MKPLIILAFLLLPACGTGLDARRTQRIECSEGGRLVFAGWYRPTTGVEDEEGNHVSLGENTICIWKKP